MKTALITGVLGQDGTYLARWLLLRGYRVFGTLRGSAAAERARIWARFPPAERRRLGFLRAPLEDGGALRRAVRDAAPEEIYHLAGLSDSRRSFGLPEETFDSIVLGTVRLLEAARSTGRSIRIFLASSSEVFGRPGHEPQTEATRRDPVTPYGIAKNTADSLARLYRDHYGLFIATGILYNHESPLRPANYLSARVARAVAEIARGTQHELRLGNLEARRDWSDARDFVRGFHLALQSDRPRDYIFASGRSRTAGELVKCAFEVVGLDAADYVRTEASRMGVVPVVTGLCGDPRRAVRVLGWRREWSFARTIMDMVEAELEGRPLQVRSDPSRHSRKGPAGRARSAGIARQPRLKRGR
jgi:GDPmannose 4,6-dehydratase